MLICANDAEFPLAGISSHIIDLAKTLIQIHIRALVGIIVVTADVSSLKITEENLISRRISRLPAATGYGRLGNRYRGDQQSRDRNQRRQLLVV
jgi:hypothetical protein